MNYLFLNKKILFLTLVFYNVIFAQKTIDTVPAFLYYKKADSLLVNEKNDQSIKFFQKAIHIYEKAEIWVRVASCYNKISENCALKSAYEESFSYAKKALEINNQYLTKNNIVEANVFDNLGKYYSRVSKYKEAVTSFEKALNIKLKILPKTHSNIADSYYNLGIEYYYTSEYDKALKYQNKALVMRVKVLDSNHISIARSYKIIGAILAQKKKYDKTLKYYQKALTIYLKTIGENSTDVAKLYNNIGNVYKYNDEYDKALKYHKKALSIKTTVYGKNHRSTAISYDNIGIILGINNEFDKKIEYHKKALKIRQQIFKKDHLEIGDSHGHYGVYYKNKKEYTKALEYFEKCVIIYIDKLGENHTDLAFPYSNIGEIYETTEAYDKSINFYEKLLTIHTEKQGAIHPYVADSYNKIARIYDKKESYRQALEYYKKAIVANTIHIENKKSPNFIDSSTILESLHGKAKVFQNMYKDTNNQDYLESSILLYQKADTIINGIWEDLTNYKDKISFASLVKEIYVDAIKSHIVLYKSKKNLDVLQKAFYYAEKSKSNVLKKILSETEARKFSGLPQSILELEEKIKIDRALYQSKIAEKTSKKTKDSVKIVDLENKIFQINRRQDSLTNTIKNRYPKYYQLKNQNYNISIAEIQEKLNEDTTLLNFIIIDNLSYVFIISKNDFSIKELITNELTSKIQQLQKSIISKNTNDYKKTALTLYEDLIKPINKQIIGNQLIIIPEGSLWHLNFDLLLTENSDSNAPVSLPYLLKKYAITYANSINFLFNPITSNNPLSKSKNECLAFSFSDSTNVLETKTIELETFRNTKKDLPGTRKEIRAIADIINGQYYFGSQATEANFKKNVNEYNILHLALHAEVDNKNPENSKLFFTKSKDTLEDNFLYSHELFSLNITAELAVLSACNTGVGKISDGEGIISLGSAFQYAGTKSLLLSNWEISDQTAPELMKYFYFNLKKGMNKSRALQQAKLQYLNTTDIHHTYPFYWGGFYLIGNSNPIEFERSFSIYWIVISSICILILVLLFLKYKRKNSQSLNL